MLIFFCAPWFKRTIFTMPTQLDPSVSFFVVTLLTFPATSYFLPQLLCHPSSSPLPLVACLVSSEKGLSSLLLSSFVPQHLAPYHPGWGSRNQNQPLLVSQLTLLYL